MEGQPSETKRPARFGPRGRVAWLVVVTALAFLLHGVGLLAGLLLSQLAAGRFLGLTLRELAAQLARLRWLSLLLLLTFAVTASGASDPWLTLFGGRVVVTGTGVWLGVATVLRLATVVLASAVARAGDPGSLVLGLRRSGLPEGAAASLDAVLALMGSAGGGRRRAGGGSGGGRGSGGGGGRAGGGGEGAAGARAALARFRAALARIARGDVSFLADGMDDRIAAARAHLDAAGSPAARTDVPVVAGMALAMLGIRAVKILPSLPFAPGHKLVVLTPLYVVAALKTRGRFGASATGASMGVASFLLGDGRYGPFEIAKHVAPGVLCDLFVPWMVAGGRQPGAFAWSLFGGGVAVGRYATILLIVAALQAPALAWAILAPGMALHAVFGLLSGWATYHLVSPMLASASGDGEAIPVHGGGR